VSDLEPETVLDGKYRVVALLGKGGMGAVYEGHNLRVNRRVAIKVMHASVARDRENVVRFEREAQAASRIGSAHVADVFDMGDLEGGERYMVMEFLDGESLSERLRKRTRLDPQELVPIAMQLLDGLARVHAAGIVHRDLKPANIFLARTESGGDFVKILDFGICKMLEEKRTGDITTGMSLMGTPAYMSPEHLEHGARELDQRADIYSVGVILYRCLSSELPYRGSSLLELITLMREGRARPLAEVAPHVDRGLAHIVDRAIEWDRKARYQSAREVAEALATWAHAGDRIDDLLSEFLQVPSPARKKATLPPSLPPRSSSVPHSPPPEETTRRRADELVVDLDDEAETIPKPKKPPQGKAPR
jgi:serine/threonine-protein kinase